jgi:hypothetical protein
MQLSKLLSRKILHHVQPLLCNSGINNRVMQPVSRQQSGKHVPVANEYEQNNTVSFGNDVLYSVLAKWL